MDGVLSKLNYKPAQKICVSGAPDSFLPILRTIDNPDLVTTAIDMTTENDFVIIFALTRQGAEQQVNKVIATLIGDAIVWLAYPKGTSKKYKCDFNRDNSWDIFKPHNMMPVRQVSIDEDWSALRFRKAEYIKNMTRKT